METWLMDFPDQIGMTIDVCEIVLIGEWCGRVQALVGITVPRQADIGCISKFAESKQ